MRVNTILAIITVLLYVSAPAFSADNETSQTEIENVAKSYMTAFFHGDIRVAANFMHPDTLNVLKQSFLNKLDRAKAAGQESQFLAQMNVKKDGDALRQLTSADLYVTLVESDHRKNENIFQRMKETTVVVVNSKLLQSSGAIVQLRITTPTGNGSNTQDTGLLLSKVDGKWKVKGNSR